MIDVSAAGRVSFTPSAHAAGGPQQTQGSFGAALDATRDEASAARKETAKGSAGGEGLSLEEWKEFGQRTGLDELRLGTGRTQGGAAGTLADQCRADLDALEAGDDSGAARERLHQAYGELVRATEGAYGHLPHDSLARILAMAEYAQKEGGLEI